MEYKQKLGNVDATLSTTDKFMRVANPKKVLGAIQSLIIVIILLLVLIFILKKVVGNNVESVWEFLASPFKNLSAQYKAAGNVQKLRETTGQRVTITQAEAKEIADSIDNCVTNIGFDLYVKTYSIGDILVNRVRTAANYRMVEGMFGTRHRNGWGGKTFSFTMKSIMTDSGVLTRNYFRGKLREIGITNEI